MSKDSKSNKSGTLRMKGSSKIRMDERGRVVWVGDIESAEFELVATSHVRAIVDSGDEDKINEISLIARTGPQGVLIQDCSDGHFGVLESASLDKLLQDPDAPVVRESDELATAVSAAEPDDDLELMDTQILRKILLSEGKIEQLEPEESEQNEGVDPYDTAK